MLQRHSPRQRVYLVMTLIATAVLVAVGWAFQKRADPSVGAQFDVGMTVKQIAPALDVTGKSLARELGLPLDTAESKPLKALGVTQDQLDHATEHIRGHKETTLKYYVFGALGRTRRV